MAWSPPALKRRIWLVEQARDYATIRFHHIRDGTDCEHSGRQCEHERWFSVR